MTTQEPSAVQCGVEVVVPLSKLKKSPRNARKTPHAAADIEALAASIAVKGVLQPPVVEPERDGDGGETGSYLVTIGEGRRLALRLLAKRRVIARSTPIRCLRDESNDAFEVSLDENVTRAPMHPADQFEAFRELSETKGWGAEEIAARFGTRAQVVRQRLRLGAVSPKLMAAYRAEELTVDQLMAFAITEDHERQEQVLDGLSFNRSPALIRRMLTEHEVAASDPRCRFIGAEAYEAAGGRIRRDLFTEDGGGWFEDVGLLDRLALERLAGEAEQVRREEAWLWAEAHIAFPQAHGLRRIYPMVPSFDEEAQVRLAALADEYDALIAQQGDDPLSAEAEARLTSIDAELRAAYEPVYDPDWKGSAGLFAVLDWQGALRIERGFVRPEDQAPEPETETVTELSAEPGDTCASGPNTKAKAAPKPLSDKLIADLSAHRTAALRDALASQPEAAFLAALHALVLQAFYHGRSESCLRVSLTVTGLASHAEGYDESVAGQSIEARHATWAARLPKHPEGAWEALGTLGEAECMSLFAHCVSLSVNALQLYNERSRSLAHSDVLAAHVGLDMTAYWQPTVQGYLSKVSKTRIIEAVSEAVSQAAAQQLGSLQKVAMAEAAAERLAGTGWLPAILRSANQRGGPAEQTTP
jgi:ParB family transcriptional regulator, chromosome partitioning protein